MTESELEVVLDAISWFATATIRSRENPFESWTPMDHDDQTLVIETRRGVLYRLSLRTLIQRGGDGPYTREWLTRALGSLDPLGCFSITIESSE